MSAPTTVHESRVDTLATLAALAGYTVDVRLDGRLLPDVTRLHRSAPWLLVADAKASEDPRDIATRSRLVGYAQRCECWRRAGFEVSLAICHAVDSGDGWLRCLREVAALEGGTGWTEMLGAIDGSDCVSVMRMAPVSPRAATSASPLENFLQAGRRFRVTVSRA